jgi:hypothetical protein
MGILITAAATTTATATSIFSGLRPRTAAFQRFP